jgi:hypothetical protein
MIDGRGGKFEKVAENLTEKIIAGSKQQSLYINNWNINVLFFFDPFMVYIPECKQQLRTKK